MLSYFLTSFLLEINWEESLSGNTCICAARCLKERTGRQGWAKTARAPARVLDDRQPSPFTSTCMVRLNRQLCSVPGSGCPGHFLDKKDLSSLSSYRDNTIPYLSAALSAHIPGCPPPSAGYTQPTCLTLPCIPVSWVTIASAGLPSGSLSAQQILFRWLKKKKKTSAFFSLLVANSAKRWLPQERPRAFHRDEYQRKRDQKGMLRDTGHFPTIK